MTEFLLNLILASFAAVCCSAALFIAVVVMYGISMISSDMKDTKKNDS